MAEEGTEAAELGLRIDVPHDLEVQTTPRIPLFNGIQLTDWGYQVLTAAVHADRSGSKWSYAREDLKPEQVKILEETDDLIRRVAKDPMAIQDCFLLAKKSHLNQKNLHYWITQLSRQIPNYNPDGSDQRTRQASPKQIEEAAAELKRMLGGGTTATARKK